MYNQSREGDTTVITDFLLYYYFVSIALDTYG